MLLSNLESVPGHTIRQQIDVVYGSTVRSKHVGRDLLAGLKNIVGGELTAYTELLEESRQEAMNRMVEKARSMGANAIVGIRFSTSNIAQGASELFVYGTAVIVDPVMPKLPVMATDLIGRAEAAKEAGAAAIASINTLNSIPGIDLHTFRPFPTVTV